MTVGPEPRKPLGGGHSGSSPAAAQGCVNGGERFPRRLRLLRPAEFTAVFDGGSRKVGRCMVMWAMPAEGGRVRLGVVTSKRALHRAVDRNLVRRRFRECFRKNRLRFAPGLDMVLVGRTAALEASYAAVEKEMLTLAGKAGLLAGGISE